VTTKYQAFVARWEGGCDSDLCARAKHVVLAKGKVPCDILFVGEAPGESEDVVGVPFVGPEGKLLDRIVSKAIPAESKVRLAFTNLVGCIPRDEESNNKAAEPDADDITACAPRLRQFVALAKPKLIVALGKLAREWIDQKYQTPVEFDPRIPILNLTHPAAILRGAVDQKGLMFQRCVVALAEAYEDVFVGG
jgi:uracil-DNA glycosylase family 4